MAQTHKQKRLSAWSTPILLIAILMVFTLLVTFLGDKSLARMAAQTLIRVTFVVGLWIFVGNSGVVSFGHVGYMAVGAYCSAWLTLKPQMKGMFLPDLWPYLASAEWPVLPAAIASGLLAAVVALVSGAAILRLSSITFILSICSHVRAHDDLRLKIPSPCYEGEYITDEGILKKTYTRLRLVLTLCQRKRSALILMKRNALLCFPVNPAV